MTVTDTAEPRVRLLDRPLTSYYLVLGSSLLLLAIGLVMVLSASSVTSYANSGSSFSVFRKQLMWVVLGLPALLVAVRLPVRVYRWLGYPALLFALATLVLVLVPGIGRNVYGATRWITVGGFTYQPSELAKLALALWGADLLVRKQRLLGDWKHLFVPLLPVAGLAAGLIMLEPDLGTTLVVLLVVMALLFTAGAPARLFGGLAGVMMLLVVIMIKVEPYRMRRITGFLDPFADKGDTGYQAVQGLYALSSGGWFGVGLGASRQKWNYLPNANTDYIFAIIGEELGLLGTLLVLVLFGVLAYAGIRIARRTTDPFVRLVTVAVTTWIAGQALINIGAVVALLPITGIPLPLISFGGSALIPTLFSIGMLASFARTEPGAAEALAASGPGVLGRLVGRVGERLPGPVSTVVAGLADGRAARDARSGPGRGRRMADAWSRAGDSRRARRDTRRDTRRLNRAARAARVARERGAHAAEVAHRRETARRSQPPRRPDSRPAGREQGDGGRPAEPARQRGGHRQRPGAPRPRDERTEGLRRPSPEPRGVRGEPVDLREGRPQSGARPRPAAPAPGLRHPTGSTRGGPR